MRLLAYDENYQLSLTKDLTDNIPPYAILSHTWGDENEEINFRDLVKDFGMAKSGTSGFRKIQFCGQQASRDNLRYFWVDTCCIDKSNSVELQEAINSMFSWYQNAARCYVYLSDVSTKPRHSQDTVAEPSSWSSVFRQSRWFRRGWTLQELLAPRSVEFFSQEHQRLGDKSSLEDLICEITTIPITALRGASLSQFGVDERLFWIQNRQTTRKEDMIYSLLGIFNVYMPLIYGEGRENAVKRLKEEIRKNSAGQHLNTTPNQMQIGVRQQLSGIESSIEGLHGKSVNNSQLEGSKESYTFGFHLDRIHIIPRFTPRLDYMDGLHSLLPEGSLGRKVFVLYGLGGIGKTQLAIKFAKDTQSHFTSIFFLDGSSQASLTKSFASMHRRISQTTPTAAGSALSTSTHQLAPERMIEEVLQWFALEQNSDWLLIFDNIDKEPSDDGGFDIIAFFPPKDHGSILITTRLAQLSRLGQARRVGRMSNEEAVALLNQALGVSSLGVPQSWASGYQTSAWYALLDTLDGLPLAISQAAQFINTLNLRAETYLDLYNSCKRDVIDMLSVDSHMVDAEKNSIRTTWTTSLSLLKDKASKQSPDGHFFAAYRLLKLFAYFEPSDLNYNFLRFGVIGNNIPEWFQRTFSSKLKFFAVIKVLLDICLVDNNVTEGSYSMHRVVHDWLCSYVCAKTDRDLLRLAVGAIYYAAPLILTNSWYEEQQQLALHAIHIIPRLQESKPDDFLVSYDEMSVEKLEEMASLLEEPEKCWKLMKFDLTLTGISRLLESCHKSDQATWIISDALSRSSSTTPDGSPNPVYIILRYTDISCSRKKYEDLLHLSKELWELGSPSWSIKALNLYALFAEFALSQQEAIKIWEQALDRSRINTGSVFMHPTWMLFVNLYHRIRSDVERSKRLLAQIEPDARRERVKVKEAADLLDLLRRTRRYR